jgi:hypothetical protein
MLENVLFSETQRFRQRWLWVILAIVSVVTMYGLFKQLILGEPVGQRPMSNVLMVLAAFVVLGTIIFMLSLKLETVITNDGIQVRFFPFLTQFKLYRWAEIKKIYVRQYNPIREYGGWGYRLGILGHCRAMNVSGDKGIQLELINNKKLLIGTRQPEEAERVLRQLNVIKD